MNAIITNTHHFCKGVTLYITDGQLRWHIDPEAQRYKYGTGRSPQHKCGGYIDPATFMDDFVALINLVFEFTGCDPDRHLKINSDTSLTVKDVINTIYDAPLEHNVKFIQIGHCGCNMGHCNAVTGYSISDSEYKTYGDLMKLFTDDDLTVP